MNKKKVLLSVTVTSMIAITGSVLAINGGLKNLSVFATDGEVWYHYAAVDPTETTHGSKEFWASSANGCLTHTFTRPEAECEERDFSTYDSFASLSRDDDRYVFNLSEQRTFGIIPVVTGDTVTYGLYPQTNVNDESLITALNALTTPGINGYYFYENAYYAKLSETTNWFKCEPITWNILSKNNGEYYILSSVLLDAHRFDDDSNNYTNSEIRSFLNNDFYNSAFALGNSHIKKTTVDGNQDNVFLLSHQEYLSKYYNGESICCKTTDWARARGADYSTKEAYLYNGDYWTRSPHSDHSDWAWYVNTQGNPQNSHRVTNNFGVRPSLTIKIA